MRAQRWIRSVSIAAVAAAIAYATSAMAAPCAGFVDVDDSSQFCPNVEWIKNRSITLGCLAGSYCPTLPVNRLSMAAFLERLGGALTPLVFFQTGFPGQAIDLDASPTLCTMQAFPVSNYPRRAHGQASLSARGTATADVALQFVESTDAGATWNAVSPVQGVTVKADSSHSDATVILPPRDLQVGTTYTYGVRVSRLSGSATTGDIVNGICRSQVTLKNRNSTTSPLDEDD